VYMGAYGLLKQKNMKMEEFLRSAVDNFNRMIYAVPKVDTLETRLNSALDYGG